jgi:hypothetical protein
MPRPGHFTPGEENQYPLYRRLDGPLWTGAKILPPPEFVPQTVHPVASHYSDYVFLAQLLSQVKINSKTEDS